MKHRRIATVLLLCWLGAGGAGAAAADKKKQSRPSFEDAAHWASVWEGEERDEWQMPMVVLGMLAIRPGQVVADLGAGTGYFTRPLSMAVRERGRVYAVDVEQAMLDHIRSRDDVKQQRVLAVLAEPDDPKLPDGTIDLLLTVNTWHHIKKRSAYLEKLARCLTPDGRLVLIDFRADDLPVGPPPKHKLSRDKVVLEFEKAGWRLAAESVALPYQYFLTFFPPREPGSLDAFPGRSSD